MGVNDLKQALSDVEGIDTLRMDMIAGRMQFGWNGLLVASDPMADQETIENAIRAAAANRMNQTVLPPVTLNGGSSTFEQRSLISEPLKRNVTGASGLGSSVEKLIAAIKGEVEAAHNELHSAAADVRDGITTVKTVAKHLRTEANDIKSSLGQFSNMGPE